MMKKGFWLGLLLTFFIAMIAKGITSIPYVSLLGPLVVAIIIGIIWGSVRPVNQEWESGIQFSSKVLLRVGIILLGMRLNISDMIEAGWSAFLLALLSVIIGIVAVYGFATWLKVPQTMRLLLACGTGICGAAAIVAVSTQVKAKPDDTAVSVAMIAIIGTLFTVMYSIMYPFLAVSGEVYGLFAGSTLHEIAHVVAAGDVGGQKALDMALVVKLTRVLLLVVVVMVIGYYVSRQQQLSNGKISIKKLPIPWFIFGFLAVSGIYSTGIVPESVATFFVTIAYLLMAMAMAGLGLNVKFDAFKRAGFKPFIATIGGSTILVAVNMLVIYWFI